MEWQLKDRFHEHCCTTDNSNNKSKPATAEEYFISSPNHTPNDMQLFLIEFVLTETLSLRLGKLF